MYARLTSLRNQHTALDHKIRREEKRPLPDLLQIRSLKKVKLGLRDEMRRIEAVLDRNRQNETVQV